jgi:hypothetical protein
MPTACQIRATQFRDLISKEIFEIHPVILGGSPTEMENKTFLSREDHIQAVRYWNNIIKDLRKKANNSA